MGPRWRIAPHDGEPFLFGHDPAEGVRAPEPLPLVGLIEQDRPDLAPRALQDLLPFFACVANPTSTTQRLNARNVLIYSS